MTTQDSTISDAGLIAMRVGASLWLEHDYLNLKSVALTANTTDRKYFDSETAQKAVEFLSAHGLAAQVVRFTLVEQA